MKKQTKQPGKPWKPVSRAHGKLAKTCLTQTEKLLLQAKARSAGMSESEWLRAAVKQRVVVARLTPGEATFVRHLIRLWHYVRQLRQLAPGPGSAELESACQGAETEINHLLMYLDGDDRESQHE
ncbi:plasmid mobilization protein [Pontibacter mangrovi]|uniref:Mobilization protein n=1 Tax=Pontibacter mangrovi TaxID=2589816 RepID=A0A501VPW5_9BACT|nr:hypothetical protein [Pontibacter mangrovi]TPE39709.1 hypothetical protein FJM65_20705 [Pontibacter mangrovi]